MKRRNFIKTGLASSAALGANNIAPASDEIPEGFSEEVEIRNETILCCPFQCHVDIGYEKMRDMDGTNGEFKCLHQNRTECFQSDCLNLNILTNALLHKDADLIIEVTPLEDDAWVELKWGKCNYEGNVMWINRGRRFTCPAETTIIFRRKCSKDIS